MSVAQSMKHISNLERKLGKANKIAAKGSDMKLSDVLKLQSKSNAICSEIKKSMTEYDGSDPSMEESRAILSKMQHIVDLTEDQLKQLIAAQARFNELRIGGMVKRNIGKTDTVSKELSNLLQSKAPAEMKGEADALEARRAAAFEKACRVFANAQGGEEKADEVGEDSD
ncbi:hypothetical protein PspLS_01120 [Pyricularia sp. CBS 133598]|nr:hypothetical protein PspLS_01120 [Pyricularia sp. CBS 133598]